MADSSVVPDPQAGLEAETSQTVRQILHSAAASKDCDKVSSTRWGHLPLSDLMTSPEIGKPVCFMAGPWHHQGPSYPLSSSSLQNGCWSSNNHIQDSGRKRKEEGNKQRGLADTVSFKELPLKFCLITCQAAKGLRKVVFWTGHLPPSLNNSANSEIGENGHWVGPFLPLHV